MYMTRERYRSGRILISFRYVYTDLGPLLLIHD